MEGKPMSPATTEPQTTVSVEADVSMLPARTETRGSRILGSLAAFFGGSFAILPVVGLVVAVREEGLSRDAVEAIAWFVIPFGLFLALLLWGINQFVHRVTIEIDRQEVRWRVRSLRGTREMVEPLAGFDGIQSLDRWDSDLGARYDLQLQHQDPSKNVLLYRADRPAGFVDKWKRYCRVFGTRPVEYLSPGEPVFREIDDIGRPLLALVREGKVSIPAPGKPPDRIEVDQRSPQAVIRIAKGLVAKGRTLTVSEEGLRIGSAHPLVIPAEALVAITIEPGLPRPRKPWLKLAYRLRVTPTGTAPELLSLWTLLADGMPLESLQWLQRYLLRRLAGIQDRG
jgi:hypothetical protein